MKLKVLFVAFLCLFSASIIFSIATGTLNAVEGLGFNAFASDVHTGFLITNEIEQSGDPIGGGGWP